MATELENALRLIKPGDMLASIADTLVQIGHKLTTPEKDKLLLAILSQGKQQVHAGDLITSALINQILEKLADLDIEVTTLSSLLQGAVAADEAAETFEATWTVYRGLIRRRVFLPLGSTQEEIAAQITIVASVRDVMDAANRQAAKAGVWSLVPDAALKAFEMLYSIQQELIDLLGSDIPGISDTQERKKFASIVDQYLNQDIPDAKPGLKKALDAASLPQAIKAQSVINQFVGTWSGEGVAVGPFGFSFNRSDETKLVPGAAAVAQFFTLNNGTDKTLKMALSATATADHGTWTDSVQLLTAKGGSPINQATLASGKSREIVAMAGAPSNANSGDAVTLTLTAKVGPPTSRSSLYSNNSLLEVADQGGGPVAGQVTITGAEFNPEINAADITPGVFFNLLVSATYSSGTGTSQNFDLDLTVESGDASLWSFSDEDTGTLLPQSPTDDGYSLRIRDIPADESPTLGNVRITPPARGAADRSVTLSLSIRSVNLTPSISHQYAQSITMVVKHS